LQNIHIGNGVALEGGWGLLEKKRNCTLFEEKPVF
jgi:hypothetical protein